MSQEAAGDKSLKNSYDTLSIDHIIQQRMQPQPAKRHSTGLSSRFQRALGGVLTPQGAQEQMPLISRKGFVDIAMIEALSDPSRSWGNFSRLVRKYDLPRYKGWGDMPRSVLPDQPDPRMLQRVAAATSASKAQSERALEEARMAAMISVRAGQIAVDAIGADDRRYYRYY
jgi:hypothetical protein